MWAAIRSAAEALISEDLPLAAAIIEASNISCPEGTLELCYDERGTQYKVPIYCYANPMELTYGPVTVGSGSSGATSSGNNNEGEASRATEVTTSTSLPVSTGGPSIKLRVRVNPGDHNMKITAELSSTVLHLKQIIQHQIIQVCSLLLLFFVLKTKMMTPVMPCL